MDAAGFVYQGRAARVVFGAGSLAHLRREVESLDIRRALVLSTPGQRPLAENLAALLGPRAAGIHDGAAMHVPVDVARAARDVAARLGADGAVAVGGGSTIGLAKALALESGLPTIAVPTTYAGSEMTPIHGLTDAGVKRTGTDLRVLPRTVIYDPELTLTLPVALSMTSGLNAIAHAAEALYARDANPITGLLAAEGIGALARGLPGIVADPRGAAARADALYGAWLCGTVLGSVGMALHHKLCHTLGGSFDLPHAPTHAVVLPHVLAYNAAAAPAAMRTIARALGDARPQAHDETSDGNGASAAAAVRALAERCGAPTSLAAIGLREADLDRAADLACANPYWNPRPVERGAIRRLLQNAFDGVPP